MRPCLPLIALGFLSPGLALAQEGPSFDCSAAESSAEELVCEDAALATLDRRLAETFAAALAAAEGLDAGAEEAADELRATQRGWIGGRDECWKAESLSDCVTQAYLSREGELTALWLLQEPTGSATYLCEGGPEVSATFFDTELPSARLEYGDRVEAATLVPTASGSRYDGAFGTYLWINGDEAMFSIEGAEPVTCTVSG